MERHATFPNGQRFQRMAQIMGGLVEEHIAEAPAEYDTKGASEEEIVDLIGSKR